MDPALRTLRLLLSFFALVVALLLALALLPALAQAGPVDERSPDVGILALPSTTGYVIDDGDTGFTPAPPYPTGNWSYFAGGGYKGDCLYTAADSSGDYTQWRPDLAAGIYEVQVHYWANSAAQRDDAKYIVHYQGGEVTRLVNQQRDANGVLVAGADSGWLSLGRFPFSSGTVGWVRLTDEASAFGSGTNVVADGVRFLPLAVWVDDNYCPACSNGGHLWGVNAFNNLRDGLAAVGNLGTANVGAGTYYQNITITKSITLTGAGAATTVITVPAAIDTAVEVLASDVTIRGFTIESAGADYGIRNYDVANTTWVNDLTGYRILNNVVRGFGTGIRMRRASGEIRDNTVGGNISRGIYVQEFPTGAAAAPTTISGNTLANNGTGGTDYDMQLEGTYTGTVVSNNNITGSGAANEVGIYVLNRAGDLTLSSNTIVSCTRGVRTNIAGTFDVQKVTLRGNTIRGGGTGVVIEYTSGGAGLPQVIIGGSLADSNSIYGNSGQELELIGYGANVTATHNYWGVCTLLEIENQITHQFDTGGLGPVTYEPAVCVPYSIDVVAAPSSLPADGVSTATITAEVRDIAGTPLPGTLIGITTSLGSVPYGYAEENDPAVQTTGSWSAGSQARAYGGAYMSTSNPGATASWVFTGTAVSLVYGKYGSGGQAEVYVDGALAKVIDMNSATTLWRVEEVITNTLSATGAHTVTVVRPASGSGGIRVDAFRSGGTANSQGRVVTALTSDTTPGTALIVGTVYDGRVVSSATSPSVYPIITDTATVEFQAADISVTKTASSAAINYGELVTFTITYRNDGPQAATGIRITDTLPAELLYVRSSSSPNREPPTAAGGNQYVWSIGTVAAGASGTITLVARADHSLSWPVPLLVANAAEIQSLVGDPDTGDNQVSAPVLIVLPSAVAITAHPPAIRVSNFEITTTLRVTVTDAYGHLVHGAPISLTTTEGRFPASGSNVVTVTTVNGVALAGLASSTAVTTATVTAAVMPNGVPMASTEVRFIPGLPYAITSTVEPTTPLRLCADTAVVTATIRDRYGNLVEDGTEVTFNVVQGDRGDMNPRLTTTTDGIAVSTVTTKGYRFGERFLDVYILSRREAQQVVWYQRVNLTEGPPHHIVLSSSPPTVQVGGRYAEITALVQDCGNNNVVDGTVVTFTVDALGTIGPVTSTTTAGRAYATFQSGCTVGTSRVTATADSKTGILDIPLEPGPADRIYVGITPDTIRNCGGTAYITATVVDVCNNLVKDNTPVLFAPQYGYVVTAPRTAYTRNGIASATVVAIDKPLATWPSALEQIDVTSGSALPGFANLTILPGVPATVEFFVDKESIPINGDAYPFDPNYYIVVEAEVTDCSGTPVEDGVPVTLQTSLGFFWESGLRTLPRTSLGGMVTGTLTSQSIAGLVTISGTAGSAIGTTEVRFLPGEPWLLEVWAYPTTIFADGRSTSLVTARVKDEYDNPVLDGVTVTFVTDYGHFTGSDVVYTTTTTIDGLAFARLISDPTPQTALVRAIAYNDRQGYTYVFFVLAPERGYIYLPLVRRQYAP